MDRQNWVVDGKRGKNDIQLRDKYIESGKIPFDLAISMGLKSIATDPWLMVLQHMPGLLGFKLRQIFYKKRLGKMGKGAIIDPDVEISHPRNVYLDEFSYLARRTQIYCPEGYVRIGKRCHIGGWILGHGGVDIGHCVASGGTILSVTDSHQGGYRMSGPMIPRQQRNLRYGKVVIEDDAFIGQQSIIMPGVHIGEGAVIAPFSLVLRNVPAWTVVYGNPAIKLGMRDKVKFPVPH